MSSWLSSSFSWAMVTRFAIALLVGVLVGLERESTGRAVGLRTHVLVSLGAALFVLIPTQANGQSPELLSRLLQAIIGGIGFIAAGVMVHDSCSGTAVVVGHTSAAALWVTVALATAAACGLWSLAVLGAAVVLLVLHIFKHLERSR